jgi:hypothetical protein
MPGPFLGSRLESLKVGRLADVDYQGLTGTAKQDLGGLSSILSWILEYACQSQWYGVHQ